MPGTNADTPDTFSGTVLFRVTKTTRYAARLLLWQWKQWLNRGTDWNNPSVCPLVAQTSCLTKLNPCWCWAFRPGSLCFRLTLCFFSSVHSFCLCGWSQVHSLGHWVLAQSIYFLFLNDRHTHCKEEWGKEMEKEGGRTQRGGQTTELGEKWNMAGIGS